MFPVRVVVLLELLGLLASPGQIEEAVLVKELVPDLAVKALDHHVLHRASGLGEKVVDVLVVGPSNESRGIGYQVQDILTSSRTRGSP